MNDKNLLATYSLLSYIHNSSPNVRKQDLLYVFVPIVKGALYQKFKNTNNSEYKGKDYSEIKDMIKDVFQLEIPIPVLGTILELLQKETSGGFSIYGDHSFIIHRGSVSSISKQYDEKIKEINLLKNNFELFCEAEGVEKNFEELVTFIQDQQNRIFENTESRIDVQNYYISKYVKKTIEEKNKYFEIIRDVYFGGLIGSYFKFQVNKQVFDSELVVDTNFYISLLDLNTEESYDTCKQLFKISTEMGFRYTILETTVKQIQILLSVKASQMQDSSYLKCVDEADVLVACKRRNITAADLNAYRDGLHNDLQRRGISIIYDAQISKLKRNAEKSQDLNKLKIVRNNYESALNDVLAKEYVLHKRNQKTINEFVDVNCWFLNNSNNYNRSELDVPLWKRTSISAADLLVLLWVANPSQSFFTNTDTLAVTSLSANVIKYRRSRIPNQNVLDEIEKKFVSLDGKLNIEEVQIAKLCVRLSEGYFDKKEIEEMTKMSCSDIGAMIDSIYDKDKKYLEEVEKRKKLEIQNKLIAEAHINKEAEHKLFKSRLYGVLYYVSFIIIHILYLFLIYNYKDSKWCIIIQICLYFISLAVDIFVYKKIFINGIRSFFNKKEFMDKIKKELQDNSKF